MLPRNLFFFLFMISILIISIISADSGCYNGHFQCDAGACIPNSMVCDGFDNCVIEGVNDTSDEANCTEVVQQCNETTSFRCANGMCVSKLDVCDGDLDCLNGEDEEDCGIKCSPNEFQCNPTDNTSCILIKYLCDGENDCEGGEDEINCSLSIGKKCDKGHFQCDDGACIPNIMVCDGFVNCDIGGVNDTSDEANCTEVVQQCNETTSFRCANGMCVSMLDVCDGDMDCLNGEDEEDCGIKCSANELQCNHTNEKSCIFIEELCDGEDDCEDGEDEMNCQIESGCYIGHFQCDAGACIPNIMVCDGFVNCDIEGVNDTSDEANCTEVIQQCDEITSFRCANGMCVSMLDVCDGDLDCLNGEDEEDCGIKCYPNQVQCNHTDYKPCILIKYLCDGDDDCEDGEDEKKCIHPIETGMPRDCSGDHFKCGDLCLPTNMVCDKKRDCPNGEDEGRFCSTTLCPAKTNELIWSYSNNAVCDQLCHRSWVHFICDCLPGYRLEPDLHTCTHEDSIDPELLYSSNYTLNKLVLPLNDPEIDIVYTDKEHRNLNITSIDFGHKLFMWADAGTGAIHGWLHNKYHQIIARANGLRSLSYDWVTHNIYFVSKRNETFSGVGVIPLKQPAYSLKSGEVCQFYIRLISPAGIAVNPITKKMVLLDSGGYYTSRIIMANMDGTSDKVIVVAEKVVMSCITIDYVTNIAYWSERSISEAWIQAIRLESGKTKVLLSSAEHRIFFTDPFSVTVFENQLYFNDNETNEVWRLDAATGKILDHRHSQPTSLFKIPFRGLSALRVKHPMMRTLQINPCDKLRCSHVCAMSPGSARCLCPPDMMLLLDEQTCVEIDTFSMWDCRGVDVYFKCGSLCISSKKVCDNNTDCPRGQDEGDFCKIASCPAKTNQLIWSYLNTEVCDHLCYDSSESLDCDCFPGYRLQRDGYSCRHADSTDPELLYSLKDEVNKIILRPSHPEIDVIFKPRHSKRSAISSIDFGPFGIVWTDAGTGSLDVFAHMKHHRSLVKAHGLRSLSYDWVTHNVYFVFQPNETSTGVAVINFHKTFHKLAGREVCPLHINVFFPISIAVNPITKKMVLIDSGGHPITRIIMANMDGTFAKVIVAARDVEMACITIDHVTNIAYWSEKSESGARIKAIRLDNQKTKVLLSSAESQFSFLKPYTAFSNPFSVTVFENQLFFNDNVTNEVWHLDAATGKVLDRRYLRPAPFTKLPTGGVTALRIKHPLIHVQQDSRCHQLQCSHVCALSPINDRCLCPRNMALTQNGKICVERMTPQEDCRGVRFMCSGLCLPTNMVCDFKNDCPKGEDEGKFCLDRACPAKTNELIWSYSNIDVCDQLCHRYNERFLCDCLDGYRLEPDRYSCRHEEPTIPKLLFFNNSTLSQLFLHPNYPKTEMKVLYRGILRPNYNITSIEYSPYGYMWVNAGEGLIETAVLPGHRQTLVRAHGLRSLSYDWVTHNVYFVFQPNETSTGVAVFNLLKSYYGFKGKEVCPLNISVISPVSIAVNPVVKKMVLIDSGTALLSRILMANMDGTSVKIIAAARDVEMSCITVDHVTNIAYWSERTNFRDYIKAIRLEDQKTKVLLSNGDSPIVFWNPFSVTVFENQLYFNDETTKEIWRIDAATGKALDYRHSRPAPLFKISSGGVSAIRITHPLMRPAQGSRCKESPCSHVCALSPDVDGRCLCPQNMTLWKNGKTCVDLSSGLAQKPLSCPIESINLHNATILDLAEEVDEVSLHIQCYSLMHVKGQPNATMITITCLKSGQWNQSDVSCVYYTCAVKDCGSGKCISRAKLFGSTKQGVICECPDNSLTYSSCDFLPTRSPTTMYEIISWLAWAIGVLFFLGLAFLLYKKFLRRRGWNLGSRNTAADERETEPRPTEHIELLEQTGSPRALNFSPYEDEPEPRPAERIELFELSRSPRVLNLPAFLANQDETEFSSTGIDQIRPTTNLMASRPTVSRNEEEFRPTENIELLERTRIPKVLNFPTSLNEQQARTTEHIELLERTRSPRTLNIPTNQDETEFRSTDIELLGRTSNLRKDFEVCKPKPLEFTYNALKESKERKQIFSPENSKNFAEAANEDESSKPTTSKTVKIKPKPKANLN